MSKLEKVFKTTNISKLKQYVKSLFNSTIKGSDSRTISKLSTKTDVEILEKKG